MLIADSQVHVWAADRPDRPWPPAAHGLKPAPHRDVPISAQSLLGEMQTAGVDRAILVPPSWEGEKNDVVAEACRRYPDHYPVSRVPRATTRHLPISSNCSPWRAIRTRR